MWKLIVINFAKITYWLIRLLNLGSGQTWPGHIVTKLYSDYLFSQKKGIRKGIVLVTGTNGKTTTTKIISSVLQSFSYKVLSNISGANLFNGVVSAFVLNADFFGNVSCDYAVLEVDESSLPRLAKMLQPNVIVLLNLSRDQLDRHWEIDIVWDKWLKTFMHLPIDTSYVVYKDQPEFSQIIGDVHIFDSDPTLLNLSKLYGEFNAKNLNASYEALLLLGIPKTKIIEKIPLVENAFGRGETIVLDKKNYQVILAKNPASQNENLSYLQKTPSLYDSLLFVLNDNIPDGLDVSWVYDIDPKLLYEVCLNKQVFISGTRALDMAVRLHYAGVSFLEEHIFENIRKAFLHIKRDGNLKNIVVLPNYSAMLEARQVLLGKRIL